MRLKRKKKIQKLKKKKKIENNYFAMLLLNDFRINTKVTGFLYLGAYHF